MDAVGRKKVKVFKTLSALFAAAPFYGMQNKSVEASGDYVARWEQFKIAEPPMGDTEGYVTADFDPQRVGNLLERAVARRNLNRC